MVQLPFMFPVRVYWEDTDAGGVVYHASYVRFLERCRSEWLRAAGITQESLLTTHDLVFAVRALDLHFRRPARLDDRLQVRIDRLELRPASLVFAQSMTREGDDMHIADATVRCACLHASTFKPRPMPGDLAALLTGPAPTTPSAE